MIAVTGFKPSAIPLLLAGYGVATVPGNLMAGRFADRFTVPVFVGGTAILASALAISAAFAANDVIGTGAFLMVGLVGVWLNPAMVARVMRAAEPRPRVNSRQASVITGALALGTWAGCVIDGGRAYGPPPQRLGSCAPGFPQPRAESCPAGLEYKDRAADGDRPIATSFRLSVARAALPLPAPAAATA